MSSKARLRKVYVLITVSKLEALSQLDICRAVVMRTRSSIS
ncbi:MAG: hypothetical protein QXN34_05570 [Archaeoglobaceae archaeon]